MLLPDKPEKSHNLPLADAIEPYLNFIATCPDECFCGPLDGFSPSL